VLERNEAVILVEAGNTDWKAAVCEPNAEVVAQFRGAEITALSAWLRGREERVIVLATVGAEQEALSLIGEMQDAGFEVYRVQTSEIDGFQHSYENISHLGVDRWLTMVALKHLAKPVVIIDVGTAITVDWMDAHGVHKGGWIAPGFWLMQDALVRRSARLRVQDSVPNEVMGTSTESCIANGCAAALDGLCQRAIEYADTIFGIDGYELYLTGGGVRHLNREILPPHQIRPHLVLEGLAVWTREHLPR